MPLRDRFALFAYRLRPLEPLTLGLGLAAAVAIGLAMIPSSPGHPVGIVTPGDVTIPLTMVIVTLALVIAFVCGRDVDVAEQLLSSTPRPFRRTLVLRTVLWGMVAAVVVGALAGRGATALQIPAASLRGQALVQLLFAATVVVVSARALGSLAGGGTALAAVLVTTGLSVVYEGFPVDVLAAVGTDAWRTTALRLELLSAAHLGFAYWRARP